MTAPLTDRIAEAKPIAAQRPTGAPPPLKAPTRKGGLVDSEGYTAFVNPTTDEVEFRFVHAGVRMAWQPVPDLGGVILHLLGGPAAEDGYAEDGIAFFTTDAGLSGLIEDLQQIRASMLGRPAGRPA